MFFNTSEVLAYLIGLILAGAVTTSCAADATQMFM